MKNITARVLGLLIAGLASATLMSCSADAEPAHPVDTAQVADALTEAYSTTPPTTTSPAPAVETTTEIPTPTPDIDEEQTMPTNEAAEAALPPEAYTYIAFARDLLDSGVVPESAVTPSAVKSDMLDNYGITITEAQSEAIIAEILR